MNDFIFGVCVLLMVVGYFQFFVTLWVMWREASIDPNMRKLRDQLRGYRVTYNPFSKWFWCAVVATIWIISGAQV